MEGLRPRSGLTRYVARPAAGAPIPPQPRFRERTDMHYLDELRDGADRHFRDWLAKLAAGDAPPGRRRGASA